MKSMFQNKNIFFLFLNSFFRGFMIIIPILTLYFQENGLNMKEIMFLQTVFSIVIVVLEIPSGYLADLFKRKYLIILGAFFNFIGILFYYLFSGFSGFLIGEILLGIGISLNSGADTAYLYDELVLHKQEKNYQKVEGKYMSIRYFSESIASFLSGFVVLISFKFVLLIQTIINFLGFLSVLFLKEHKKTGKEIKRLRLKDVYNFLTKENTNIRYLIIFYSVICSSTLVFIWLSQPFWKEKGLELFYFGIVWGVLNLLVSIFSLLSHKLEQFLSFKKIFIIFWIFSFIFYLLLGFSNNLVLVLIISSGFWIFRGLYSPIIKDYINKEVNSNMRATVISIQSLFFRIVFSILSPTIGYFADIYSLQTSLLISASIFGILGFLSLIFLIFRYN